MDQVKDGGPAFPCGLQSGHLEPKHGGMSLRDYFAAKWLQGWVANPSSADATAEEAAGWAYAMADAMLKARETNHG